MRLFDYTGVIHLHSEFSFDGSTPITDIIAAAEENKIDFLMLTDHGHLMARDKGLEGWHGKTLLIVGQEISPRFNHYLAFGINQAIGVPEDASEWKPQTYIDQVAKKGGFGIIAHPDHQGAPMFHVKHYPWNDWNVSNFDGMGIWDFMTDWQSSLSGYGRAVVSYLFPFAFLRGPRPETLRRWDALNQNRPIIGVAECDNHNTRRMVLGMHLAIFPFKKAFKYLRTHVLLDSPFLQEDQPDILAVYKALKSGRAYIAHDYLAPATGFTFSASDGKRDYGMGDEWTFQGTAHLSVELPIKGKVRVIADGQSIYEVHARQISLDVPRPGVYRIEVYLKAWRGFRPWIFSNPIYIREN